MLAAVGDRLPYVSDVLQNLFYDEELDRTVFEFQTRRGTAFWPFAGNLTDTYKPGDEVSFRFQVVEEYSSPEFTFESLDYFQAAEERLLDPGARLCIEDYRP